MVKLTIGCNACKHLLTIIAFLLLGKAAMADCQQYVARVVSLQGEAEKQPADDEEWHPAQVDTTLCPGDKIRTALSSRATLELTDKTYMTLDQKTSVVFSHVKPEEPSWLELLMGVIYVRSRTPNSLDIKTPFINATIRGTEFMMSNDGKQGQVTVFEGKVESSNGKGRVMLTDGQSAVAGAGEAPVRKILVAPRDAVQWALYYPPVIDLSGLRKAADPAIQRAVARYQSGDGLGALAALEGAQKPDPILRAGLLLSLGRAQQAQQALDGVATADPRYGEAQALRAIVALAHNNKAGALRLAQLATAALPQSATAWTALSYARQATFDLEGALEAARKAADLDAENGLAQTRVAELLDANGRRAEALATADRAIRANPRLSRAWTVRGFALLSAMETGAALQNFGEAIRLDSSDPLPRFGQGLAKIRRGQLQAGAADMEIAASLDPDNALTRSYLGKAYYEQRRSKLASTEYGIAKQLDPRDPTPWFYDAIKKQTENRPVEALDDMQKAIELNDNRAVYRSRQTLDDDLAARSAAVGRIYNDLGFGQRALLQGWESVNADPSDYSGHRFLADNYANLPNHELARVSELLQSQLLQPINLTPIQPHLAERNLAILSGLGPTANSFNEFNPLFMRDGVGLQTSGIIGNNDTYGDEVVLSGLARNVSYSLGQYHNQTSGFRPNNSVNQDIYNAFVQADLTPDLSVQAEYRHRNLTHGYLNFNFDLNNFDPLYKRTLDTDTFRAGANYRITPRSNFILSGIYRSDGETKEQTSFFPPPFPPAFQFNQPSRGYIVEGQYLFRDKYVNLNVGGGYEENQFHQDVQQAFSNLGINLNVPKTLTSQGNAYIYSYIHAPRQATWILGGSVDLYKDGQYSKDFTLLNPKFGLIWEITPSTTLRAAAFRSLKRSLVTDQTIEPTQVAGFNQLFDDFNGTKSWRYGVGLDQKFSAQIFAGVEVSRRDRDVLTNNNPFNPSNAFSYVPDRETVYRTYASWAPNERVAVNLSYQLEVFDHHNLYFVGEPDTHTHFAPLSLRYFHPSGWFGQLTTTYVNQSVTDVKSQTPEKSQLHSEFALVDTGVGYRLPGRHGIVRFDIKNLFDQKFSYQGAAYRTPNEERPLFYPTITFMTQFTLAF